MAISDKPGFVDNKDDLTAAVAPKASARPFFAAASPGDRQIAGTFAYAMAGVEPPGAENVALKAVEEALRQPDMQPLLQELADGEDREAKFKALEKIFADKQMGEALKAGVLTPEQVSSMRALVIGQLEFEKAEQKEKADQAVGDFILLDMLRQMENDLAARYGENFAEDLLSDLHEKGLVDEDGYNRIMAIKDQDERRQAIAVFVKSKLDDGTISKDDLKGHPWAEDWLDLRMKAQAVRDNEAKQAIDDKLDADEIGADARYKATSKVSNTAEFIKATENQAQETNVDVSADDKLSSFDIDSMKNLL